MPEQPVLIVVSQVSTLIDWGKPSSFTGHMMHQHLEKGHIIRYVTQQEFDSSSLKPKK